MWTVQLINESKKVSYSSHQDLENLLLYVCNTQKTYSDSIRPNPSFQGPYICCSPSPFPGWYLTDSSVALQQMQWNHQVHPEKSGNLAKHRVVSFDPNSMVLPQDLVSLGQRIISFYASIGYITLYAVHADHMNPHLHIVVDGISFQNGTRFHIPFELRILQQIVQKWSDQFDAQLLRFEKQRQARERILFGKPRYESIPLSCAAQIKTNKAMHY